MRPRMWDLDICEILKLEVNNLVMFSSGKLQSKDTFLCRSDGCCCRFAWLCCSGSSHSNQPCCRAGTVTGGEDSVRTTAWTLVSCRTILYLQYRVDGQFYRARTQLTRIQQRRIDFHHHRWNTGIIRN